MKVLVTGASGFIGSFIVEESLRRGYETWAAVRKTSSRRYLQDSRIHFIELAFGDEDAMTEQFRRHQFDYIVDAAGATKCRDAADYFRVNTDGVKAMVNALLRSGMDVRKFVFFSSLSAYGAPREKEPHEDIRDTDPMMPNTAYGKSKLEAERFLATVKDRLNYTILRPTGVYGPREKDYFLMVKSISQHMDAAVGYSRQDITFVYVMDVVVAVFLAFGQKESGRGYFLSDGNVYESATFSHLVRQELGNPWCLRIVMPICIMKVVCTLGSWWANVSGKITALNKDKFHILAQRNWRCDITPARRDLGYTPKTDLKEGVKRTVAWYKQEGWI